MLCEYNTPKDLLDKTKTLAVEELSSVSNICTKALSFYINNYDYVRQRELNLRQNTQ